MKVAKTAKEAFKIQESYEGQPHGWIQWKGTSVCMDVVCECGESGHVDAKFACELRCCKCNRVYFVNGHVELIRLEKAPTTEIISFGEVGDDSD